MEIAKYVITYSVKDRRPVSNLKLQKLLYFIQGVALVSLNRTAFDDQIEAWPYGPVIPSVYYEYASYGSDPILLNYNIELEKDLKEQIDIVLESLKYASASSLVTETHKANSPWDKAYNSNNRQISNEAIKNYFKEVYYKLRT